MMRRFGGLFGRALGWSAALGLISILGACRAPTHLTPWSSGAFAEGRIHHLVQDHRSDGRVVISDLSCETEVRHGVVECVVHPVRFLEGANVQRSRDAREEMAGALGSCPIERVMIQSGTATSGYWVFACGRQRFIQRVDGAWVDRTPAGEE